MSEFGNFRVGVAASGGGTTFEATQLAIKEGLVEGIEIGLVICNNGPSNPDAEVWGRAKRLGVDIVHVSNLTQETCTLPVINGEEVKGTISYEASARMVELANEHKLSMMVGLGFMRKIIGDALELIPWGNEHPGPLGPKRLTAGEHGTGVQEKAMRLGLAYSGPTFHWMDKTLDEYGLPAYDMGPEVGHQPVLITDEMKAEWAEHKTVEILKREVMRVEREMVPQWIVMAGEQLRAAA